MSEKKIKEVIKTLYDFSDKEGVLSHWNLVKITSPRGVRYQEELKNKQSLLLRVGAGIRSITYTQALLELYQKGMLRGQALAFVEQELSKQKEKKE